MLRIHGTHGAFEAEIHLREALDKYGMSLDKVKLRRGGKQVGDKVVGGEELQLPREVRTRWNSLLSMIQAYIPNENNETINDPEPVQECPPPFKKSLYEDHNKFQRSLAEPP